VKNPKFDDQPKHKLVKPAPTVTVDSAVINKLLKWSFVKKIEDGIKLKDDLNFEKQTNGKRKGQGRVAKLEDANFAGKNKKDCVLCITEGDSAATYVVKGMKYGMTIGDTVFKGRDTIGVYPIRGKFVNVKNAGSTTLSKNNELIGICKALGVQYGVDYTDDANWAKLRYKKVCITSDSDSVTGDTPLLVKKDDAVQIKTIDSIAKENQEWQQAPIGDKQYNVSEYQVWTEEGWTDILHVMKHQTTKKMFRVVTHTGIVDVTEDHSLICDNGSEITPNELKVNDTLLHSFLPPVATSNDNCGSYSAVIVHDKLTAQTVYYSMQQQGYDVIVDLDESNAYVIKSYPKTMKIQISNKVTQIIPLGEQTLDVYDLETSNHHFQAGIGQLIVHNTDGYHISGLLYNLFHTLYPSLLKRKGFFCFMRTPIIKVSQ
ncbi:MAG: hypothetical protein EBX37_17060, partial [Alphaproteobacteria bacterium]|nr:hypothetical protein [Alphaproteobacteria bacterium]